MWEHNYSEDTGICIMRCYTRVSLVVQKVESLPAVQEGLGSIPGSERSSGEGNGNPLWYSCLENYMDRGAWWATVSEIAKSWT